MLHRLVDLQAADDPVQRQRHRHRVEQERYAGGDEEMRGILHVGLPGGGQRQRQRLQGEGVDDAGEAALVDQHEAAQQHERPHEVRHVIGEVAWRRHQNTSETKRKMTASSARMRAAPRNSPTRKTRILAMLVSNTASRSAAIPRWPRKVAYPSAYSIRPPLPSPRASPQGAKMQAMSDT